MNVRDGLPLFKKKKAEEMSPSQMVSREAERVEHELLQDLLTQGIIAQLYQPFRLEKVWYEPEGNSYRVKLTAAGEKADGKKVVITFLANIPDEHITDHTLDSAAWNKYMRTCIQAWTAHMLGELRSKGATRALTSPRKPLLLTEEEKRATLKGVAFDGITQVGIDVRKFKTRLEDLTLAMEKFKTPAIKGMHPRLIETDEDEEWAYKTSMSAASRVSKAEMDAVEESLKQSAERRAQRRTSRGSA